jgi:hypothetical protein
LNTAASADQGRLSVEAKTKAGEIKVEGTEGVWDKILNWWERCYRLTLEWISDNPVLFAMIVGAFTFWRWQAHLTKVELARQKAEYADARTRARLPKAPQKGRGRK